MHHRQCRRMKDHTDNKMNLSLDYSLQLSTPLDYNDCSIPIVGANGLKAGILQTPSLHHLSPKNMTMSPCQPTRMKESCVNRKEQQEKEPASQAQLILRSDTAHPFNFMQKDKSLFTLPPYWRHSHLHCRSSLTILVLPRQTLNFQPIDSSPPDKKKK